MELVAGIYRSDGETSPGWERVCEREKLPYRIVNEPEGPLTLIEGAAPEGFGEYLRGGGVAIVTGARPDQLPFSVDDRGTARITRARFPLEGMREVRIPALVRLFRGPGWGEFRQHEKRITKHGISNDRFPLVLRREVGDGVCYFSGVPLTRLLTVMGDTLRPFGPFTEVTERICGVDKALIARILVWSLRRGFRDAGVPYPHLWYFPGGAEGVFMFRVDVDGVYGDHLHRLSEVGRRIDLPLSVFLNKQMSSSEQDRLKQIDPIHEIGNHADVHNLFDSVKNNRENIRRAEDWIRELGLSTEGGFVAPRGMWNQALGEALEREGYEYSGDFSLQFHGFPYFPRIQGSRSSVLQIPPHPYSVERAVIHHEQHGKPPPRAEDVLNHFLDHADYAFRNRLPVVLYSHPEHFGPIAPEVLPGLKEEIRGWGARIATHREYSDWWKKRDGVSLSCEYDPDNGTLKVSRSLPESVDLRVLTDRDLRLEGAPGKKRTRVESFPANLDPG